MSAGRAHQFSPTILLGLLALSACGDDDDAASDTTATPSTSIAEIAPTTVAEATPTTVDATTTPAAPTSTEQATTTEPTQTTILVPTPDEMLDALTGQQIADIGGMECATEFVVLISAGQRYFNEEGVRPESPNDLVDAGYLTELPQLWAVDRLQPKPGSGCMLPPNSVMCTEQARALTIARLTYLQAHPDATEPTQADLLDEGLIGDVAPHLDLVDGALVANPGGVCDGIDVTIDWERGCVSAARTMEVAWEAYYAQNGNGPESEGDLVTAGWLRSESPLVDLSGENVVAAPGGPCEGVDLS